MPITTKKKKTYWVYILLCDNGSYYTGYTNDLEKRYESHVKGTSGCKYTKSFKPIRIAQSWIIKGGQTKAMRTERMIKQLSRLEKEKIIKHPRTLLSTLKTAR